VRSFRQLTDDRLVTPKRWACIHLVGNDDEHSWCGEINEMELSVADDDDDAFGSALGTSGQSEYDDFVEQPAVSFVERPMKNVTTAVPPAWIPPLTVSSSSTYRFQQWDQRTLDQSGHFCTELSTKTSSSAHQRWIDAVERSQQSLAALQRLSNDGCPFLECRVPRAETVPCSVSSHENDTLPLVPSGHCAEPIWSAHTQQRRWMDSMERSQQSLADLERLSSGACPPPHDCQVPHAETVPRSVPSRENDPLPLVVSSLPDAMDATQMHAVTPVSVCSSDMHSNAALNRLPHHSTELLQEMQALLMHRLDATMTRSQATNPFWATANLLAQVDSENLECELDTW
jgi:hypothetical protein